MLCSKLIRFVKINILTFLTLEIHLLLYLSINLFWNILFENVLFVCKDICILCLLLLKIFYLQ